MTSAILVDASPLSVSWLTWLTILTLSFNKLYSNSVFGIFQTFVFAN